MITGHCPDCGAGPFTEAEFVAHTCGVVVAEPEMVEAPATTRDVVEALQALALQIALVNETCQRVGGILEQSVNNQAVFQQEMLGLVKYYVGRVEVQE